MILVGHTYGMSERCEPFGMTTIPKRHPRGQSYSRLDGTPRSANPASRIALNILSRIVP